MLILENTQMDFFFFKSDLLNHSEMNGFEEFRGRLLVQHQVMSLLMSPLQL